MGIRIQCLCDNSFDDGSPGQFDDTMKIALRILDALRHVSAAVWDQLAVLMVQEIAERMTKEAGYSAKEISNAERVLRFVEYHTVSQRCIPVSKEQQP